LKGETKKLDALWFHL